MGPGLADYLMQIVARVPGGTRMAAVVLGAVFVIVAALLVLAFA